MSGMYAQYHGPEGLKHISTNIHKSACTISCMIKELGYKQLNKVFFDTVKIDLTGTKTGEIIRNLALEAEINFFYPDENSVIISTDEITTLKEISMIVEIFAKAAGKKLPGLTLIVNANVLMRSFSGNHPFCRKVLLTDIRVRLR